MKKLMLIAVAAFAAFTFSSCAKDYSCVCADASGTTVSTSTIHSTKSKATTACSGLNQAGYYTCTIK